MTEESDDRAAFFDTLLSDETQKKIVRLVAKDLDPESILEILLQLKEE